MNFACLFIMDAIRASFKFWSLKMTVGVVCLFFLRSYLFRFLLHLPLHMWMSTVHVLILIHWEKFFVWMQKSMVSGHVVLSYFIKAPMVLPTLKLSCHQLFDHLTMFLCCLSKCLVYANCYFCFVWHVCVTNFGSF